jgi:hypothetical protein
MSTRNPYFNALRGIVTSAPASTERLQAVADQRQTNKISQNLVATTERHTLDITHVPTGFKVSFPAFIEMMSDAYMSNWTAEDVYGRMDPIATFQNTRRALALSWNVPAESYEDAEYKLGKVNRLLSFLYPLYDADGNGATVVNQGPLLRIRFGNFIKRSDSDTGLLGYVNGFTFDPDFEAGLFYSNTGGSGPKTYMPKTFRLNFEFNVLHEHALGFKVSEKPIGMKDKNTQKIRRTYSFVDDNVNFSNFPYSEAYDEESVRTQIDEQAKLPDKPDQNTVQAALGSTPAGVAPLDRGAPPTKVNITPSTS